MAGTGGRAARWSRAAVGIVLALTAGCGDSKTRTKEPPATPTVSASASATRPVDPVTAGSQAAMDAYRDMWDVFVAASNSGQVEPPELAVHTAGTALTKLNKGLALNRSRGLKSKGEPRLSPKVTAIGPVVRPSSVSISDCVDDSQWLLYKKDGQPADDEPGGRRSAVATVTWAGDAWKVTTFALQRTGTC